MATATVSRFHPPKTTLFPHYIKRQKTVSYPEVPPRGASAIAANSVRTLAWSPLGTQIATGTTTRSIRIWDPEKPRLHVCEFQFRGEKAEKLLFHPGGEPEVVSVGEDGMVRFWDVRSKGSSGEVKAGGLCFTLAWSPDGRELVVGKKVRRDNFHLSTSTPQPQQQATYIDAGDEPQNDDLVRIDRATRTVISTTRQRDQTNQTCFNWTGDSLLTTTTDGFFKILDYASLDELARFPAHNSSCNCVAYHPGGVYVATGASDGLISLYRTDGWTPAKVFDAQAGPVKTVSFSCDGSYIIGGSDEGTGFEIGNVETGESVHKVETKVATPVVMWSPRDYAIAYAPSDWGLRVIGAPTPT